MDVRRQHRGSRRWVVFLSGAIVGGAFAAGGALLSFDMIEATNTDDFCASCHEMEVFRDTWRESVHGTAEKGVVFATCIDCHLPPAHEGLITYLYTKGRSGAHDYYYHLLGHETDWIAELERREEYTYESGCRKCHVELTAPDISLKAILAHKDYESGKTEETCISCHIEVGHGDLKTALAEQEKP